MTRRSQQGFTLVELMVVVAILAILATLAVVSVNPRTTAIDIGHRFRALVDTASRDAVRLGPVRPDVVTATGIRARTQIVAAGSGTAFYVQRLVEDTGTPTATWQTIDSFALPAWVSAAAFSSQLGPYGTVTTATDWSTFSLACFPDGTCERKTVFFESSAGSTATRQARVAVLPVAAAQVISRWN